MPIYEYGCKQCGVFEVTQRITESPLTTCPTCGGDIHRLISLTSFVLKGSGWYATDYARPNEKGESSDSSSKEGTANGSADKGAASPPEAAKTSTADSASSDKSTSAKPAA